jgi:signal transduction histidine kinase
METRALQPIFNDRATDQIIRTFNNVLDQLDADRREILSLSERITEHAEMTLKNVAQELHDQTANDVAALFIMEQNLEKLLTGDAELEHISLMQNWTVNTLQALRRLSAGLQPVIFDESSLLNALNQLKADRSALGVSVELNVSGINQVPRGIALAAFRITQESVNNAIKHGNPNKVIVTLNKEQGRLKLIIEDDGTGFRLEDVTSNHSEVHLGLTIMQDRAALTGGSINIQSEQGVGTIITAYLGESGNSILA